MNTTLLEAPTHFSEQIAALPGHALPWLNEMRASGLAQFSEIGFPNRHQENWKYTRLTTLEKQTFHVQKQNPGVLTSWPFAASFEGHRLVWIDGQFSASLSQTDALPSTLVLSPFSSALHDTPTEVQRYLTHPVDAPSPHFFALNLAYLSEGVYLVVPKNTVVETAIALFFISTRAATQQATHLRNRIVVGENSQAVVMEHYYSLEETIYFNNVVTDIQLEKNAHLDYYRVQQESTQAYHVAQCSIQQQRDSRLSVYTIEEGAALSHSELCVNLEGEGSACTLNGLYLAKQHQHLAQHTRVDHIAPHTTSREHYRGIITDDAHAVFDGKVKVHPDAQKIDAELHNQNLLLSPNAEIDTKPQLEIDANDVKCSHGATIGQLDEQALFYLRSRGIDDVAARQLLVNAFAQAILKTINSDIIRQQCSEVLSARWDISDVVGGIE